MYWKRVKQFVKELIRCRTAFLGAIIVLSFILVAIFAPFIAPHDPLKAGIVNRLRPPFWMERGSITNLLGADEIGRDILSRIIYGARVSILVGLVTVAISGFLGTLLGSFAGYFRGRFDAILSRFADLLLSFPYLIFAIFLMSIIGPGFFNLIVILCFKSWVNFFRLSRGEMISEKTKEYVEAAQALGESDVKIIFKEILPNIIHSLLVLATLRVGFFIILEASLSFLGLGIQPPTPAWGSMINSGRAYMLSAWWVSTIPGIALLILVLSINLLGEGLRDILDPRLKLE
ncbi:ABC transporter permease [Candidatus Atribacteria bacterium 1244-E10-H5-B2]|nr:MAG: ABC transporter permease [Candidatus Atribacteria bacterium 1244-E10-H5-B2]